MKIYNWRVGNLWVDLAVITANFAKVPVEEVFVSAEDMKSKEWKQKSITGKTPLLETPSGNLLESAAIARYLASVGEGHLAGSNPFETAQINQWVDFSHTVLLGNFYTIIRSIFGHVAGDANVYNNAVKDIKETIKLLNTHLQGKSFFVGERITVADISIAVQLVALFQTALDAGFRKAMPNVTSWIENFIKNPEVISRVGHVKFTTKALKPLLIEKKKEEVKVVAPIKKEKHDEEDDGEEKKPASGKNPLDHLPPSKFVLPEFKTYFVNLGEKKSTEGMKHFFEHYDPEGYCIYFIHYEKYTGEGVLLYQTSNLMNGFIQRMDDKFRNHSFSVMAILGEEPALEIQGVWMFRGTKIPQEMIDHPQFEYFKQRELKITNEADRQLISEFFCAKEESIANGLKIQEIKSFK